MEKKCMKLLKAMYPDKKLSKEEVCAIIGKIEASQPNERISFLRAKKLIIIHMEGEPDGEGGYLPETVKESYSLSIHGREVVEDVRKEGIGKLLDLASNLLP